MNATSRHTLAAAILAGIAFSASAQNAGAPIPMGLDVLASSAAACPPSTFPSSPSYRFEGRHIVQNGWVCESLYRRR